MCLEQILFQSKKLPDVLKLNGKLLRFSPCLDPTLRGHTSMTSEKLIEG